MDTIDYSHVMLGLAAFSVIGLLLTLWFWKMERGSGSMRFMVEMDSRSSDDDSTFEEEEQPK